MIVGFWEPWTEPRGVGGGATTNGPDATPPPTICQNLGGGGSAGGCMGGDFGRAGGGGGSQGGGLARDPRLPHAYLQEGCASGGLGVWRYVCDNSAFSSLPRRKS